MKCGNFLKTTLVTLGICAGLCSIIYLCASWQMTLKELGLGVHGQFVAQRVLTPFFFLALAAMAISANWFWKRHGAALPNGKAVMFSRLAVVVVLSLTVTLFTANAPFWSYPSPGMWDRPRFNYGWPIMWKGERMQGEHMIGPLLNLIAWTVYFMLVLGYRKWKNYVVMSVVFVILFVPYAKFVGIRTHYRNPHNDPNAGVERVEPY